MLEFFKSKEKLNTEIENEKSFENTKANDVEYFVFKNKGVVVCKLHNCKSLALDRISKYANVLCPVMDIHKYFINDVFTGVAKCSPDDSFDLEYGKKLALTKAKASRGKAINNAINLFIKNLNKSINNLQVYGLHEVPNVKAFINGEDE